MKKFFRENGLSVVLLVIAFLCVAGQLVAGHRVDEAERREHGERGQSFATYVRSPHCFEALAENWESEFLQMAAFVVLTIGLKQKGSSESKPLDETDDVDADPRLTRRTETNWPTRRGGLLLAVYEHSLTIALVAIFAASFVMHAVYGARLESRLAALHGGAPVTTWEFLRSAQFWFESFQNWQSEFLSIAALVLLSVFLRQRGSPQSKPVAAPHHETGG